MAVLYVRDQNGKLVPIPSLRGRKGDTPVRGVDYWTEEDVRQIQGYIDDKISDVSDEVDKLNEEIVDQGEKINELSDEIAPLTNVKDLFKSAIVECSNANLLQPEYVFNSRYSYDSGEVYHLASTAVRNAVPVAVAANTGYSFQSFVMEQRGTTLFIYDKSMTMIGTYLSANQFLHFTTPGNAAFINFHIGKWDEGDSLTPKVMIWETESESVSTEFIPYGSVQVESVELPMLKVPQTEKNTADISSVQKQTFDDSFNFIAYSHIENDGGSINTAEHFVHCAKLPFDMLKGDVRPTSDGGVIMCHDAGFTLNGNGDIIGYNADNCTLISNLTEAECLALKHASTGNYVCNLEKFLAICKKYGKVAYITIRDEHITDVVAPVVLQLLDKYHMRSRCIINSFNRESLQAVRDIDANITLSLMSYSSAGINGITTAFVDYAIALGNCRVGVFCFLTTEADASALDASAEAIAYAAQNDIRVDTAQVGSGVNIDDILAKGVTGAHMVVAPDLD